MLTSDQQKQLYEIERQRQFEKEEMIFLLLMLFWWCEEDALRALQIGGDPGAAVQARINGHPSAPGAFGGLAQILNNGYAGAYQRGVITGGSIAGQQVTPRTPTVPSYSPWQPSPPQIVVPGVLSEPPPQTSPAGDVEQMTRGLLGRIGDATTKDEISEAFDKSGVTKEKPFLLDTIATTGVNDGMQAGLLDTWLQLPGVTGFLYCSVLDRRTTDICLTYDEVQLPKDHPWWKKHWPANHWRCRATILPLMGWFIPTKNPPWYPPPMVGFGIAPAHVMALSRAPIIRPAFAM